MILLLFGPNGGFKSEQPKACPENSKKIFLGDMVMEVIQVHHPELEFWNGAEAEEKA